MKKINPEKLIAASLIFAVVLSGCVSKFPGAVSSPVQQSPCPSTASAYTPVPGFVTIFNDSFSGDFEVNCQPYLNTISGKIKKIYQGEYCEKSERSRYFSPYFPYSEETAIKMCTEGMLEEQLMEKYNSVRCPLNCPVKKELKIEKPLVFCEPLRTNSMLECILDLSFRCEEGPAPSPTPCPSANAHTTPLPADLNLKSPAPTSDIVSTPKLEITPIILQTPLPRDVNTRSPSPTPKDSLSAGSCTKEEEALLNCKYGCFLLQPGTPHEYYMAQFQSDQPVPMCKQVCKEVRAIPGTDGKGLDFSPDDPEIGKDMYAGVYITTDNSSWQIPNSYNEKYEATGKTQDGGRIDNNDNSYAIRYFCSEHKDQKGLYTTIKKEAPCKKYRNSNGDLTPEIPYSGLCCRIIDYEKNINSCYSPFEG